MAAPPELTTLLVDGYNVIGAWRPGEMQGHRDGLEALRELLIGALANYSAFQGYQTRIVFDAHQRRGLGVAESLTRTLEIYYTEFGETADSYIELYCAQARSQPKAKRDRLIVATSDRAQQLTVLGYGAEWMSARQLISDMELVSERIRRKQQSASKSRKRLLSHSLDASAQQKLERWRYGLQ